MTMSSEAGELRNTKSAVHSHPSENLNLGKEERIKPLCRQNDRPLHRKRQLPARPQRRSKNTVPWLGPSDVRRPFYPPMTVGELIELLKTLEPHLRVEVDCDYCDNCHRNVVSGCHIEEIRNDRYVVLDRE